MNILQTRNLTKYYGKEPLLVKALDGINMEIEQGSFTAIVGRSGSGKSTLLHMLGGLDCPTGGSVMVDGQELSGLDSNELTIFRRRKIGFVFQNFNLMPNLNIYDNIVLPVELDGRSADDKYLKEIVTVLGLEDKLKRKPGKLSGGQQQRAAIARALVTKPAIILADEPTGNLDSRSSEAVIGAFLEAQKELNATTFMVTHDSFSASYCDRVIVMKDGWVYTELTSNGDHRQFMEELLDVLRKMNGGE